MIELADPSPSRDDTGRWPDDELERLGRCPLCAHGHRKPLHSGLSDTVFRVAPGRWTLWRCLGCTCAYLDPRPTPRSIARAYAAYYTHGNAPLRHFLVPGDRPDQRLKRALHASHYRREYGHRLGGECPLGWLVFRLGQRRAVRAGQFIRHLAPSRIGADRLLDVGCGDGAFLRIARTLGWNAAGLEPDMQAAMRAQRAGFDVRVGTIESLALPFGRRFDQVTMHHVLEHLHEPVAALQRIGSWMNPGGRLWLQTPNIDSRGAAHFGAAWRGLEAPRHLVLFNLRTLRSTLERAGFERVTLHAPQLDASYYVEQSRSIADGADPYAGERRRRRAARRLGERWDRDAIADPARAESITVSALVR